MTNYKSIKCDKCGKTIQWKDAALNPKKNDDEKMWCYDCWSKLKIFYEPLRSQ